MIPFLKSPRKRALENAAHMQRLAKKVLNYRRDVLTQEAVGRLEGERAALKALTKTDAPAGQLDSACQSLHAVLQLYGGKIYPVKWLPENVEMFLVAAIVALGIRFYFIQPFKIPTNSMWPTYAGMVPVIYPNDGPEPSMLERARNKVMAAASHYNLNAPTTGLIEIPLFTPSDRIPSMGGQVKYQLVKGRKWFGLLPAIYREYVLYVNGKPTSPIRVPFEFNLDDVILKRFYRDEIDFNDVLQNAFTRGQLRATRNQGLLLRTSEKTEIGRRFLSFDILSGDMLFVDRFSYHWRAPRLGEPIVFHTREIVGLRAADGKPDDKYYIKRLVGLPGDILEIREPVLYRNGAPITGAQAFLDNAEKLGNYVGYVNRGSMKLGAKVQVPAGQYYALGDNSPHSGDSRYWDGVPEPEVVGRAVFIFYPFSNRWGVAH